VHERSLDSDFGLALALDAQAALRPNLRILAMSATLDGVRFAALMDGAPVIESQGRSHPIAHVYLGRSAERRLEDEMAGAIRRALSETGGSLLAFLPASPRSSGPPSGWTACRPAPICTGCMGRSIPPSSGSRSGLRRMAGATWCSPPRSPKPA
jgi:hypothetical protein